MRLLEAARRSWASAGRLPTDLRYETFARAAFCRRHRFGQDRQFQPEIVVPENKSMLDALTRPALR